MVIHLLTLECGPPFDKDSSRDEISCPNGKPAYPWTLKLVNLKKTDEQLEIMDKQTPLAYIWFKPGYTTSHSSTFEDPSRVVFLGDARSCKEPNALTNKSQKSHSPQHAAGMDAQRASENCVAFGRLKSQQVTINAKIS